MPVVSGEGSTPTILVTGDVTVDWAMLAPDAALPGLHDSYRWERPAPVQISHAAGSAALLYELLRAAYGASPPGQVFGPELPPDALTNPADQRVTRSYALWQEYPIRTGSREPAWRMRQFLGLQPEAGDLCREPSAAGGIDCLAIDDANLGFRDRPERWPPALGGGPSPAQIVLKMSTPLGAGPLWERLIAGFADRLTVYCAVGDLRKEYAPIGQPLSWERTGSDVVEAVASHPTLRQAARVVVSLGLSGAVVVEREGQPGSLAPSLIYDPQHQEGDWERARPGSTPGLGTAIAAALALACAANPTAPNWRGAIRHGLAAGRLVHERGFTPETTGLAFPLDAARLLTGAETETFHLAEIPADARWQISDIAFQGDERQAAERIVLDGEEIACRNLPLERMGAWSSIDRIEIESMRSVRNIIREYLQTERRTRPLCLAVFGPPGSGKSFAIKQMAKVWIDGGAQIDVLEFNLSQFAADELPRALQRVRDCAVEQRLPLVFWDEFDTALQGRELGWLAQLLAPMQDGIFLEDGVARPIGPAIFIFAGGTHAQLASFKDRAVELPAAKATDFLSRLRGFVDILGPNPRGSKEQDCSFVLRRALLLRALLKQKAPQLLAHGKLQIDPGVLRAFLDVTSYVHGARSMEAIVDMSALTGRLRYERSALPPQHQLGLHLDAEEFLSLVRGA